MMKLSVFHCFGGWVLISYICYPLLIIRYSVFHDIYQAFMTLLFSIYQLEIFKMWCCIINPQKYAKQISRYKVI